MDFERLDIAMSELAPLSQIAEQIKDVLLSARQRVARQVNDELLKTYWEIGRIIVEGEQAGDGRAQYGSSLIPALSDELTRDIGKGFSRSNLANMRLFYLTYPIFQTVSGKLGWSHYCELIYVKDEDARSFYEQEAMKSNWSVREMKRQIGTSLFERLLLSDGKANKEKVLELARTGIDHETPDGLIKNPYVFEFLGVAEQKPALEKDLEQRLIKHIEEFLLELGRGFMFVGSQQRMTIGNTHHYVDMVFYNKILKAYVLIDLKMGDFKLDYAGQMNGYLNYFQSEVNDEGDNPPVGIILCSGKKDIVVEYALGGLSNQVFASSYVYYIPDKDQLADEVQALLEGSEV